MEVWGGGGSINEVLNTMNSRVKPGGEGALIARPGSVMFASSQTRGVKKNTSENGAASLLTARGLTLHLYMRVRVNPG